MSAIDVRCGRAGGGWLCLVRVREGPFATEHRVTVDPADLERIDPGAADPERLVRAGFAFLLEREPASSILRASTCPSGRRSSIPGVAGVGNVYKSEVLYIERVDPFVPLSALDDATLGRVVDRARALLVANRALAARVTTGPRAGESRSSGKGRASRPPGVLGLRSRRAPCRRCGTLVRARRHGDLPRLTYWCPRCQASGAAPTRNEEAR